MWVARRNPQPAFTYVDLSAVDLIEKRIKSSVPLRRADAPSRARQLLIKGDILVSTVRPNLNGVAAVSTRFDGAIASTGFCVLRPRNEKLLSNYLMHWVRSPQFVDLMVREATGASYPAVSDRIIKSSPMPVLPLNEQQRIAEILDKADALRRKRKRALDLLEKLSQSIFLEMFGDPLDNPKQWPTVLLRDLVDIDAPLVDPRRDEYLNLLHYGPDRIEKDSGRLLRAKTAHEDGLISNKFLCDGTHILYSKIRPYLNKVALSPGECLCSADVYPLSVKPGIVDRLYIWFLLRSSAFLRYAESCSNRANIPKVNREQFLAFPAMLPPIAGQEQFSRCLYGLNRVDSTIRPSMDLLDNLFASLQHRAFSGQL